MICGPILLDIFINDPDNGAEGTLRMLASDIKLGDMADRPDGWAAVQRNLVRLEKWADRCHAKFDKRYFAKKCKAMYLSIRGPMHQYRLGVTAWKAALQRRIGESL